MNHSDQLGELAAALAAFRSECPAIARNSSVRVKTKGGGGYSFDYATLDHIMQTVVPVLSKHNLAVSQMVGDESLTTMLLHTSGQYLAETTHFGKLSYGTAQDLGSIITYLRRYALSSMLGLVADEDDDGNVSAGNSFERSTPMNGQASEKQLNYLRSLVAKLPPERRQKAEQHISGGLTKQQASDLIERLQD